MANRESEQLHWLSYFAMNGQPADDQFRESFAQLDDEELPALVSLAELHHVLIRTFEPVTNSKNNYVTT